MNYIVVGSKVADFMENQKLNFEKAWSERRDTDMKVICDEINNTKEDIEKKQINITLVPENERESEIIQKAKERNKNGN